MTPAPTSERAFEDAIECALLRSGPDACPERDGLLHEPPAPPYGDGFAPGSYHRRTSDTHYDRHLCLIPCDVIDFLVATQPRTWNRLKQHHGADVRKRFLSRLARELDRRGALDIFRKGIKDSGCKFDLAYFRPASGLNEETRRLHAANLFSVIRQLRYSTKTEQSVDMALFLNGIPFCTAELKNPLTAQNVEQAILQYRSDRDPREPLFAHRRCLAHFAVDPNWVFVTTHLRGPKTRFLPFNRGKFGGAGNPPVPPTQRGYATDYLWDEVWARDSILDLIRQFIHEVKDEDDNGRRTTRLIFPRYQQLDAVRRMVSHARRHGAGRRYLIQHSAGSGKSFTIAWLAHQLSTLHDAGDRSVFDSIVVVTDRRVLDRQLQRAISQFEQTLGVVENIDRTSRQLRQALESGKRIIVTTLQKFPVIAEEIGSLPGKRFAVIVDEAHSSQSGESSKSLKAVLASGSLEAAEAEEAGGRNARGGVGGDDPLRDGEARSPAQPLHLRVHGHSEGEDSRALWSEARGRQVRALPPLQHATGDRGGIHPRCPRQLHDVFRLLEALQDHRGRPALRKEEGGLPAQVLRRVAPARDRPQGRDHDRALRRRGP